jgi:hypothetical protein
VSIYSEVGGGCIITPSRRWCPHVRIGTHRFPNLAIATAIPTERKSKATSDPIEKGSCRFCGCTVFSLGTIPLEILSLIVSFIDPFDEVRFNDRNHRVAVKLAPLLMQVCRSLRCAVQVAKFWLEPRFTFDKLVPSSHLKEKGWDVKLCGALVSDANLLPILKPKIDWSFRNFDTFELVARYVGLQHVHSLSCDFDTVPPTLQYLSKYRDLTNLSLIFDDLNQVLDLDRLTKGVANLPLRRLYLGYPRKLTGSLRGVQNLEELTLTPTDPEKHGEIAPASVFPFDSAATLRTLTIFDCMTDSLLQFPYLESLRVEPGWDADYGMDDMLASYPGKLSQFSIHIPLGHDEAIDDVDYIHHWALFDCDAVSQVMRLDLIVEPECGYSTSNYNTICTYIVTIWTAITYVRALPSCIL